ncbi:MAG: pilus assembly protein [Lachnospiraceae bacterium]|nr:pilus assembly protein [Lachnospiraceae bacterium]
MKKNQGSATVEATLILPIFIFVLLGLFGFIRLRMAEAYVYEAAVETVEYMAQVSYLSECSMLVPKTCFKGYVDNGELVDNYIQGGVDGVSFIGTDYLDEDGYVCLKVSYGYGVNVPLLGSFRGKRSYVVRQKAYVGVAEDNPDEGELSDDDIYVYITDNREAYHMSRHCTHLDLTISMSSVKAAKYLGYTSCSFCKGEGDTIYVTKWGDRYHSDRNCGGLKRTLYRVKKSQVEGLGACQRCGY